MSRLKLLLFLSCIIASAAAPAQLPPEIAYEQVAFDSDTCCWRELGKLGRKEEAGRLIVLYLGKGKVQNAHSLKWHAGQAFAGAGKGRLAKRYINKTYNVFYKWFGGEDGKAWYHYAKGVKAFVRRNKKSLIRIVRHWDRKLPKDKNCNQLKMLLANWELPYDEALR